jgi:poly(3-hydroxybutyrate) depolymerase
MVAQGEFQLWSMRRSPATGLRAIVCPLYLLAGESDDITTSEQVFAAENLVGTLKGQIKKKLVPGGHIGLFMGSRTLKETWPRIARWLTHSSFT